MMDLEVEKAKDGSYTARIKSKGRITFSNNGLNSKQLAYKKLCGLYKSILSDAVDLVCVIKNGKSIEVRYNSAAYPKSVVLFYDIPVKEINC